MGLIAESYASGPSRQARVNALSHHRRYYSCHYRQVGGRFYYLKESLSHDIYLLRLLQ